MLALPGRNDEKLQQVVEDGTKPRSQPAHPFYMLTFTSFATNILKRPGADVSVSCNFDNFAGSQKRLVT